MTNETEIAEFGAFLERERETIVRLWAKRLTQELQELEMTSKELRTPLDVQIRELARLVSERGEDALHLWPETVRSHGAARYAQRFEADDLAREYKILHGVLLRTYSRRMGPVPHAVVEFLAELLGEALASVQASYARYLRTEEVRFREAALMESILHNVDVGILLVELDGSISYATPPAARLLGIPVRSLLSGQNSNALGVVLNQLNARHADGSPFRATDMPYSRVLKDRLPVRGVVLCLTRATGDEVILEVSALPVWSEGESGHEMVGVLQTLADRTESRRRNLELSKAYEELRKLQGRLLQKTRAQALGQLASGAAHALNNFLNVIRLRVTLLRREFKPDHLDALDRTVKSIGDLVGRLQEFSTSPEDERTDTVPFQKVLEDALELARPELRSAAQPITLETSGAARAAVRADTSTLREILVNLLLVAKERLSGGGAVHLKVSETSEELEVSLRDDGPSYSDAELERLFEPLKGTSSNPQLSLLLAVARTQVQRWNGSLRAVHVGEGERGIEFKLRLPIAESDEVLEEARGSGTRSGAYRRLLTAKRVLVVDDDLDNARMMAEVLGEEGYEIQVAHSGAQALSLWDKTTFDAALLDVLMPDMSGWELARELRKRSPEVLLAMVTGGDVRGQNRNNLAMVDGVFRKPIDVGALDDFLSQSQEVNLHSDDERGDELAV